MTFRQIVTWPLRQVDRINPLASGGGYMLRNYPTLWRTSILKIIWYLCVAHLCLWLAGWWVSQSFSIIPIAAEVLSFSGVITALAFLIGLAWFVSVWQTPLIKRTFGTVLLTWAVYACFIYGLTTTTRAYFAPVSLKVAGFYEPRYLEHDAAALKDPLAHVCKEHDAADPREAVRRLYGRHPDHSDLAEMVDALYQVGTSHCPDMRAPGDDNNAAPTISLNALLVEIFDYRSYEFGERYAGYTYEVRWYYDAQPKERRWDNWGNRPQSKARCAAGCCATGAFHNFARTPYAICQKHLSTGNGRYSGGSGDCASHAGTSGTALAQ